MSELDDLRARLGGVIESRCAPVGCNDCDLAHRDGLTEWDGTCVATDLHVRIMEIEMDADASGSQS